MMMKWFQHRDPKTTVVSYTLEDELGKVLATVSRGGKKGFLVTIPPSQPFSRTTVQAAKKDTEWVLQNRK